MPPLLNLEEQFLWDCAQHWRFPEKIILPKNLDWNEVIRVGVFNRMATLLCGILDSQNWSVFLSSAARTELEASAGRLKNNATWMSTALTNYLDRAKKAGIETVVLKGLSISSHIYGNPAMRPGGDIDILVRKEKVQNCIQVLEQMGVGAFWPNLMDDRFYARHHLHQQRSTEDLKIWFEIHWALDHPYTLLTIDYEGIFTRARQGELLGCPVIELALPDLLLTLAVHLVKHAIYLPDTYQRPDIARAILADGMLMYYLDIAETIRIRSKELNWEALVRLAQETGTIEIFGSVLRTCQNLLGTPIPGGVLDRFPVKGSGLVTKWAMNKMVDREIATYQGQETGGFWDAALFPNGAFILRPIRLLETLPYFFPKRDYLTRKYGHANFYTWSKHFFRATGQFLRFGWDSLYFAWERFWRLKRIGFKTSLSNRLNVETFFSKRIRKS